MALIGLDPSIWGPHFWFYLHTVALTYPKCPNATTKKKYYDFIHNLPMFLPIEDMGNSFSLILDKYPVTPYLDSRQSFVRWMHFVHNKINAKLGKPEITLDEALTTYYDTYKPKKVKDKEQQQQRERLIFGGAVISLCIVSLILYRKY